MFRFNVWGPETCNVLPTCGEDCHDLNHCSDNFTYSDPSGFMGPSGESYSLFSTYDENWNLTCLSGFACGQEVYDVRPKYNRHYAPCCWELHMIGGSGEGTCNQNCERDLTYFVDNPGFAVDISDSGIASVYIRHNIAGWGTGNCNTPEDQYYTFYSGEVLIGTISDPNCGMSGSGLNAIIDSFIQSSSVPSLCYYDNLEITYSGHYTPQACQPYINYDSSVSFANCVPLETIVVSGYPGCYTQEISGIGLVDPWGNAYTIPVADRLGWQITGFEVSGVTGVDDGKILESGLAKYECNECQNINREWIGGDWNGTAPFRPEAICCDCPSTDMCLNDWGISLDYPSGYIILGSPTYGEVARWGTFLGESGCVIEVSGGPHTWNFDFVSQVSPGSGQSFEDGFWQRCNFSGSNINLEYNSELIVDIPPSADCEAELAGVVFGNCEICFDRNGPLEFLVEVDIDFIKHPTYIVPERIGTLSMPPARVGEPTISKVPPAFSNPIQCPGPVEFLESPITRLADSSAYCIDHENNHWNISTGTIHPYVGCDCQSGPTFIECQPNCINFYTDVNTCICGPEITNGNYIVTRLHGSCFPDVTIRPITDCPCDPCVSGLQTRNRCTWGVYPPAEGLSNSGKDIECIGASGITIDNKCPCYVTYTVDANGDIPSWVTPMINDCYGCTGDITDTLCSGNTGGYGIFTIEPPITEVKTLATPCTRDAECLCQYGGPVVSLSTVEVSGIDRLFLTVAVGDSTLFSSTCGWTDTRMLDVPFSSINQLYDCDGDPYGGELSFDCDQIDETFIIPDTTTYLPVPWDSGTLFTSSCRAGGTVRVSTL